MVQYFHLTSIFTANLPLSLLTIFVLLFLTSSLIFGLRTFSYTLLYYILSISDLFWSSLD